MITPVVQVVTGGSDSPAIVAAISGGVVGLAGIASTIWVATRSIGAESGRARLDAKRRTYARFLAVCNEAIRARIIRTARNEAGSGSAEKLAAASDFGAAATAMMATASEVRLIAPANVESLAAQAVRLLPDADLRGARKPGDYYEVYNRLVWAMRADLGEPVPESAPQPVQPAGPVPGEG